MCCVWRESAGNVVNNIYLIVILMRLILMIVADTRRGASCDTQHGRRLELSMNFREVSQWTEKTTYLHTSVDHSIFLSVEVLLGVFNKEKALLGSIKHCERSLTALVKVRADETWLHSVIRGRDGATRARSGDTDIVSAPDTLLW